MPSKTTAPGITNSLAVRTGSTRPLGATVYAQGVNFCIYSKHCKRMELLLFERPEDPKPAQVIELDPDDNRTYHYWHVFVPGIGSGQAYAFRAHGPHEPAQGLRFDPQKVLLDPFGRAVANWQNYSREAATVPGDNCAQALRSVVVDTGLYDWEDDTHPRRPYSETVVYEMHVGGFTRHHNSGVSANKRGTFAGLIEKIPYLQELGITAVELMPVFHFGENDAPGGLTNYWGYSPIALFAPHAKFSSRQDVLGPVDEFRDMVKHLHRAGIEVILDVVFNHTAEDNERGPTYSFKGLANNTYYILESDLAKYKNFTGCGNTVRANHPITGRLILESLRYWRSEMHVDGFRFDLASALTRDIHGEPEEDTGGLLWSVESDPDLAGAKLIAEAWDISLYQVGAFVNRGDWFAEWNGPFRDDARRFVKGDEGSAPRLAMRILGSPDIYTDPKRSPHRSIHFITCHDGFTLNDLVSYNQKHNLDNGEENRDGADANYSWNCGVEGPSDDPEIESLRIRQLKNLLTILFVAQGTPMLLMGDEVRRTQRGNNNAYCHDNELNWFDWSLVDKNAELLQFTRKLIMLTQSLELFRLSRLLLTESNDTQPHIVWHGVKLNEPDWHDNSHSLAFSFIHPRAGENLQFLLNAYWQSLTFELPPLQGAKWHRVLDTGASPGIWLPDEAPLVESVDYELAARSTVILMALPKKRM